ncbi:MAG: T9SS type A sorting domain-containing protein [Bacteroidia bacterium]|nr:T9SS type A sorting domain-containing protein [Bacteroidia bacterium]
MKKRILVVLLLAYIISINAQAQSSTRIPQILKPGNRLSAVNAAAAKQYLQQLFSSLTINENSLIVLNQQQSAYGQHILFAHVHQGKIVYQSTVKINTDNNGNVLSVINNLILFDGIAAQHALTFKNNSAQPVYAMGSEKIEPMYVKKQQNESGVFEELLLNQKGEVIQTRTLDLFFGRKDTVVQTKVFYPDPLTSAQKNYGDDGGVWVNKNGTDYTELNAQRKQVAVSLEFESDTFYTANPYAIIVDMESPATPPYKSTVNNFDFKRSQPAFREMMSLYHIKQYRTYLNSIALPFSGMFRIQIDVDAYQGQDQSRFSSQQGKPGLFFGTGGVPDAEDADVIIHEYTHGIAYFIAPNTTGGNERLAVEEANCDFMACQYSKAISDYKWRQVFNWDGHNVYWDGRDANSANKYPKDLNSDFYKSSVIWSSMLNDLSLDMGRDVLTKILLQSIYNYADDITMQQAAEMLVAADSLMYGKMHYGSLKNRLVERGFDVSTGLNQNHELENKVAILNTAGFAMGNGDIQITTNLQSGITYELINMEGKTILSQQASQQMFSISPQALSKGMYLLKISSGGVSFVSKVVRVE